jgi:hypothetical protein
MKNWPIAHSIKLKIGQLPFDQMKKWPTVLWSNENLANFHSINGKIGQLFFDQLKKQPVINLIK